MYNIYLEEKRQKEKEDKEKKESEFVKYRKKFKSKIKILYNLIYRTSSNNVSKL